MEIDYQDFLDPTSTDDTLEHGSLHRGRILVWQKAVSRRL